jgi:hypothetical protein
MNSLLACLEWIATEFIEQLVAVPIFELREDQAIRDQEGEQPAVDLVTRAAEHLLHRNAEACPQALLESHSAFSHHGIIVVVHL